MKSWIALVLTLFLYLFFLPTMFAQDTTVLCAKRTIVIRKNTLVDETNKDESTAESIKKEPAILTDKTTIENTGLESKKDNSSINELAKLPTLAGGEFGLMNIQPYHDEMDLQQWNYVAIQYSVNEYGWAIKAEVLKTNNAFLKSIVLEKLRLAKWNPPINKNGEPFEYRMYPQVVLVKGIINEEDYYND